MMKKFMFVLLCLAMTGTGGTAFAQQTDDYRIPSTGVWLTRFTFAASDTGIDLTRGDNAAEMEKMLGYIDDNIEAIGSGAASILVEGFYAGSQREAARIAGVVKSEIRSRRDIPEANISMETVSYGFAGSQRLVLVSVPIRVPDAVPTANEELRMKNEELMTTDERQSDKNSGADSSFSTIHSSFGEAAAAKKGCFPYCVAVRTNLLYDAFLLPTLGIEWRVSPAVGIKLDAGYAYWGKETDNVQKVWLVNPEVRWYLGEARLWYVGAGGTFARYNTYGYLLGALWPDDTGYQGRMWSAGVVGGYQLSLSHSFSLDFNLGLGYVRSEYDSFNMVDGVRVSKAKDKTKSLFGLTQAGINLVWTIGGQK